MNDYLALGDSLTKGYGVESSLSFPSLYAAFLRRHNPTLQLLNCGVNGLTTGGLLNLLRTNHNLCHTVSQASLITLTIGSNDLLDLLVNPKETVSPAKITHTLKIMRSNFTQIGEGLRRLNLNSPIKVAALYNPLPAGPYVQYFEQAQGVLNNVNALIVSWARCYGVNPVDIDREFRGKEHWLIAQDYVHPNAAGYQVMAKAFARH